MQVQQAFTISADALATSAAPSDRFVNVAHFVPLNLASPIKDEPFAMTPNQIDRLARTAAFLREKGDIVTPGRKRTSPSQSESTLAAADMTLPSRIRDAAEQWRDRGDVGMSPKPDPLLQSSITVAGQIAGELSSEFGLLFLDRTRIRPMGFCLGEHLTTLSLAPGEEVTIEQKTYTKMEQSYEETQDNEVTKDQELSSTYSNELSESLDWQTSLSNKSTNSNGAKLSGTYEGIGVEASTQTANDLNDGDTRTTRDSLKLSETNTRKVASKQRQQHKIVMRLSQESRFETGSKRVIRNQNSLAPIDLLYFKILQRLLISQERYGIRLCWAPTVADPAGRFFAELEQRRLDFMTVATAVDVGAAPVLPSPPPTHPAMTRSVAQIAGNFDPVWGGQSANYVIDIPAPPNYIWDGASVALSFGFTASRPAGATILSQVSTPSSVQAIVHVGIEDCHNPTKPQWWEAVGTATITLTANFLPSSDTAADAAYAAALAQYQQLLVEWKAKRDAALADANTRAATQWQQMRADLISRVNIVQEVVGGLIDQAFPRAVRDEPWELDFWERVFDFNNVSVRFYPAWWNGRALRDPDSAASSFLNASWARVYVPIRPGAEDIALRWLIARSLSPTNVLALEAMIAKIIAELKAYRVSRFGSEDELQVSPAPGVDPCPTLTRPYKCLDNLEDYIPTDGTHLEVLQATTSGADDDLSRRLQLQNDLQQAKVSMSAKDVAIKDVVANTPLTGLTSHVEISVPETREE